MRSMETGVPVATNMNEDRIRELEYLGFVWALRGTAQEETFAPVESASTVDLSDGVAGVVALATDHHSVVKDYDLHQNNHHSDHDTNSINQGISSEHNAPNTKVENEYLVTI